MTGRLRCIGRSNGVMWIWPGSSSSTALMRQPRAMTGRLRCIARLNGVMWMWPGSSSSTAPTRQPRAMTGRLRCIGQSDGVMWMWPGSSLITTPCAAKTHKRKRNTGGYCECRIRAISPPGAHTSAHTKLPGASTPRSLLLSKHMLCG